MISSKGAEHLGVRLDEHIAFAIEALRPVVNELGIANSPPGRSAPMADQTTTLKVGDPAPDFTLKGTGATKFTLSDHRGKNVVLAFFPAAFSPVCSRQMPRIQAEKTKFDSSDVVVVSISVDNTWALDAFAKQLGVEFPILSDFYPHGAVSEKYGVLHQAGVAERAVIGIDREGTVRYIEVSPMTEIPDTEPCLAALKH